MRRFRHREARTVRRLAKALAALDREAGSARPKARRAIRGAIVAAR